MELSPGENGLGCWGAWGSLPAWDTPGSTDQEARGGHWCGSSSEMLDPVLATVLGAESQPQRHKLGLSSATPHFQGVGGSRA